MAVGPKARTAKVSQPLNPMAIKESDNLTLEIPDVLQCEDQFDLFQMTSISLYEDGIRSSIHLKYVEDRISSCPKIAHQKARIFPAVLDLKDEIHISQKDYDRISTRTKDHTFKHISVAGQGKQKG